MKALCGALQCSVVSYKPKVLATMLLENPELGLCRHLYFGTLILIDFCFRKASHQSP